MFYERVIGEGMSNTRQTKVPRGAATRLQLLGGQGKGRSPRQGKLHAVGSQTVVGGRRISKRKLLALPEPAARGVHVVKVSLLGADPPIWRRLELPSAMTLDRLHEVLQWTFAWNGYHVHAFETACGEFGNPPGRGPWLPELGDESTVALAQVAGAVGDEIVYVYDFGADWRHQIVVERIIPAAPGVAYPRCTAGYGNETPDENSGGIWAFNVQRAEDAAEDVPPIFPWIDEIDPELETEELAHLATVIVPET